MLKIIINLHKKIKLKSNTIYSRQIEIKRKSLIHLKTSKIIIYRIIKITAYSMIINYIIEIWMHNQEWHINKKKGKIKIILVSV